MKGDFMPVSRKEKKSLVRKEVGLHSFTKLLLLLCLKQQFYEKVKGYTFQLFTPASSL